MNNIIIKPHYCSREEYDELKRYLNNKGWDWQEISSGKSNTENGSGYRTIEILNYTVEYYIHNDVCMPNIMKKHIETMIQNRINKGTLYSLKEQKDCGWWKIIK